MKQLAAIMLLLATPLVARADITSNLQAWWKLDEPSGTTAADSSGNANNGTYQNSPALNQTGAFATSKAVAFTAASTHYVSTGGITTASTNTMTIAAWIKPNGTQSAYCGVVFSRGATVNGLQFDKNGSRRIAYTWNDTSATYDWAGGPVLTDGAWSHVVCVVNNTTGKIYVNGALAATNTTTHSAISNPFSAVEIARDSFNGLRRFNGTLDDVRIYNRALTDADVSQLYAYTGLKFGMRYYLQKSANAKPCERFFLPTKLETTWYALAP